MTSLVPMSSDASAALIEQVVIRGDLSQLTPTERANYYGRVCESIGINPLTKPFDYLEFKDDKGGKKLVLYAKRDCTDQLRNLQHVSVRIVAREQIGKLYIVTARASMPGGREDEATGAVALSEFKDNRETELKGERLANALMKAECVPLDSEILTRRGWKTHEQVERGEEVLAFDSEANVTRWTPLRDVSVYLNAETVQIRSAGGQFDARCTPNHSWAVRVDPYRQRGAKARGQYKNRGPERKLVETNALNTAHRIILAAAETETTESLLSPAEAAILGWAVTDGTIQRRGSFVRVGICQSKEENFEAIRETINAATGTDGVRELVSPGGFRTFPSSGRTYATLPQHWWYLPSSIGREILARAGFETRADLPSIATRLSSPARKAMLQAMMLAEGDARGVFANGDPHVLDAFEILCALEGKATGKRTPKDTIFTERLKKTRHVAMSFLTVTPSEPCAVWCPTTDFGTWVMRQNGRVMITGNTKAKRRVTLSICGLGWLDESEVADADDAAFSADETPSVPHNFEPKALAAVAEREPGEDNSADLLTVSSVRVAKTGKNGDRPWTLFIVKFSSGLEASTFSETVANAAKELAGTRTPVEIETEEDSKGGRKLVLVQPVGGDNLGDALDIAPVVKALPIDLSKVYRITEVTTAARKGAPYTVTTSAGHKLQSTDPKLSLLAVSAMQSSADVILSAQMVGEVLTLTGLEEMGS